MLGQEGGRILYCSPFRAPAILDIVWVVGSYASLFAVRFSIGGKWAVAVVAELVFLFAVMQWLVRRVGRRGQVA